MAHINGGARAGDVINTETFTGANATGSDGAKNRVLTLANTSTSKSETIIQDRNTLHPTTDYTVNHLSTSSTITFLKELWNEQSIKVMYFT